MIDSLAQLNLSGGPGDQRRSAAVAIGFFDGVHVGHQELVRATLEAARARGLRSVVLTFANH
ncbi:MAG: hypothetical protein COW34_09400, partial [Armatimonadetes bacterium CG17_big_fil_post_rev_8_21_14_2_50_66_6]